MKKTLVTSIAVLLLLIGVVSCSYLRERATAEEVKALTERIENGRRPAFVGSDKLNLERWQTLVRLYESRQFRPAWIAGGRPQRRVSELTETLSHAPEHGLDAANYKTTELPDAIDYELRLSWVLVEFASDLAGPNKPIEPVLSRAIEDDTLPSITETLAPQDAEYQGLRRALQQYRDIEGKVAAAGEWTSLPTDAKLRFLGNLQGDGEIAIKEGLNRFESRHGLPLNDSLSNAVSEALNISPDERIQQIELNMQRLRQLPVDLGEQHIRVNIPGYELKVFDHDQDVMTMKVVVGKTDTPTPIFSADMTHIVFSPYWNIPESILTKETLPSVLKDKSYLERQNIEVVRVSKDKREIVDSSDIDWSEVTAHSGYQLRQKPGDMNSLGLVKFMMPNRFDVYLHDTPADSLFGRMERDFSHGCVRLEKPLELAVYLLRNQPEWPESKIVEAMHSGDETTAKLKTPIPVHIMYMTAWLAADGTVNFRKDIYGLDVPPDQP